MAIAAEGGLQHGVYSAGSEEELAFISDHVVAILRSPTWVSPISKFVDDNCSIFEDVEENKLEYTLIHNAFKQLVDDLLVAHLIEMSLTTDQFVRFCQRGLSGNSELHRSLVEQLISVDDFLVFKAMMVKRNCDIAREVLGPPLTQAAPSADAGSDLQPLQPPTDEAAEEAERLEAERRCVEAELQLAEALSVQLEKRLQLMEALDEVLELVSKIYKLRADALEQQVAEERAREQEMLLQAQEPQLPPPEPCLTAPATLAPVQLATHVAPAISSSVQIRPLHEAPVPPPIDYSSMGAAVLGRGAGASPNDILALERKKAEAALQKERASRASQEKRQELMKVAMAPAPYDAQYSVQYGLQSPAPPPAAASVQAAPAAPLEPTEDEKLARAEHLKRQRAALIEKKNREREGQLANFQMQHGATNASCVAQHACATSGPLSGLQQGQQLGQAADPDAGRRLAAELSGLAQVAPAAPIPDPSAAAVEMRKMLTRQLKNSFA